MTPPQLRAWQRGDEVQQLFDKEWLVTNGLGGYASGTLGGACTRRFHGLLVAALPAPLGRILYLGYLEEALEIDGRRLRLSGREDGEGLALPEADCLESFTLENGLPVWRYGCAGLHLEKCVYMAHLQNTVFVRYRFEGEGSDHGNNGHDGHHGHHGNNGQRGGEVARLLLRPFPQIRPHEGRVDEAHRHYSLRQHGHGLEIAQEGYPPLHLRIVGGQCAYEAQPFEYREVRYRIESSRGYEGVGPLHSPGMLRVPARGTITLIVSTEPEEKFSALSPQQAFEAEAERRAHRLAAAHPALRAGPAAQLVLAADQFVVLPKTRAGDTVWARASGDEARTIIAGYHWFTDWGRDTMISLEGLCLRTGRALEAGYILRTFAHHVKDGLIPNMFPEGEKEGLYHTADATLWFFHAVDRYLALTGDRDTLRDLLPILEDIIDHHLCGTRFGIRVDAEDGLLMQGEPRCQLTWMDAKVGDWVVTPRRGKAVEINALFHNALQLLAGWLAEEGASERAAALREHAARLRKSFNRRFWNQAAGHLFDVVDGEDGDDAALRPNQLLAISLRHAVLDARHWQPVLQAVEKTLLTSAGLRSLAPRHPDYKAAYDGDLRARDAAYHQGTVWAWLIGPYVDAWLKVNSGLAGRVTAAAQLLEGFHPHMNEACVGTISEIFDAEPPFRARGCVAQAWSIAEVLRCRVAIEEARAAERRRDGGNPEPSGAATG
jgi:predicted glycogen debranching enzyme